MATALVLLVAANSALSGFPRLLYFIARDGYAPRAFLHLGDRLAFSVGIIALTVPAAAVYVASDAVPSLAGGDLAERQDVPGEINHLVVVPVAALDLASLRALAYAASLGVAVLAVHVCPSDREDERFRRYWEVWGEHLPLQVVRSPYRATIAPLAHYIEALHRQRPEITLTVVVPEVVPRHGWQRPLHHRTAARLRRVLARCPGIIITRVPFHPTSSARPPGIPTRPGLQPQMSRHRSLDGGRDRRFRVDRVALDRLLRPRGVQLA